MIREAAYVGLGLFVLAVAVDFLYSLRDDPREPPRLWPRVPLVGHLIGLIQHGPIYPNRTSRRTDLEMYSLALFGFKVYVSNSPRVLPLLQKHSKSLSFRPFIQKAAKAFAGVSDHTFDLYGGKLLDDFSHVMKNALAPGPHLDEQNLRMGEQVLEELNSLVEASRGASKNFGLLRWCRDIVVQASSCGIWGAAHPFRDPAVEAAFWKWQEYVKLDLAGLTMFTGKGQEARETVVEAMRKYYASEPKDAAWIVWERHRVQREAGVSEEDLIRADVSFPMAVFPNTTPTLFWSLYELFSRPEVLADLRQEVETQAVTGSKQDGFVLDVGAVKTRCPLLLSVIEESQRMHHQHASIRAVMNDTLFDDGRYLLKAGNYLQMPGEPIHKNADIWGPTAGTFDAYRFVPKKNADTAVPPSAFLPWGAPPHLCPARQFATTEIMIAAALSAVRLDLRPRSGRWERNMALEQSDMSTLLPPKEDPECVASVRERWDGVWRLKMSGSLTRVSIASG